MPSSRESDAETRRLVTFGAALIFVVLLVRTAWVCDSAYVTFRAVDNFLHGYGLRWNTADRVQAYSNPLWMLVMVGASAITRDVYYTSIVLSILLSVAVVIIIGLRLSSTSAAAMLAFSALILSKSFVEYSTSGLENALTNFLLVIYLAAWMTAFRSEAAPLTRARVGALTFLAALLMVNRLDIGLLIIPALVAAIWTAGPRRIWPTILLGLLPLIAWELFAISYYGFPLPNSTYARLATGLPRRDLLYQGILYLFNGLSNDPLTMIVIVAAVMSPLVVRDGGTLAIGIGLYLAYVVWIGGDSMGGRFLAAPFLCAVVYLFRAVPQRIGAEWAGAMAVVWLAGFLPGWPSNFSSVQYGRDARVVANRRETRVYDQRRASYAETGLLTAYRGVMMPNDPSLHDGYEARRRGEQVHTTDAPGFLGYGAGPQVYVLDRGGLRDPLMARLPTDAPSQLHEHPRTIPDGYKETIETGRNVIRDSGVAAFYDKLRVITEEPLWSGRRWRTIVAMNLGRYDRFLADYGKIRVPLDQLAASKANGTPWDQPGNIVLTLRGAEIALGRPFNAGQVEISVSGNDTYTIEFLSADRKVGETTIVQPITPDGSLLTHVVAAPAESYDTIVVRPSEGDGRYSLGHLRLIPG